jgi:hypothetical protein
VAGDPQDHTDDFVGQGADHSRYDDYPAIELVTKTVFLNKLPLAGLRVEALFITS